MILIAIPKSASTALMKTMEVNHNFHGKQLFKRFKDHEFPSESKFVHKIHSDIKELYLQDIELFTNEKIFYKQHIFPTRNNLDLLKNTKKVILLREVDQILLAYRRGAKSKVQNLLEGFDLKWSEQEWLYHCKSIGLKEDLVTFSENWKKCNDKHTLIIYYKDLINSPKNVINQVEEFYNLPITKGPVELVKARFSRKSNLQIFVDQFKRRLYKFYSLLKKGKSLTA